MSEKMKIALYWCSSCGGCEESVVDLAEDILLVVEAEKTPKKDIKRCFELLKDKTLIGTVLNKAKSTTF